MKDINDLVNTIGFYSSPKSFKEQREDYEKLTKKICKAEVTKKKYDDLLREDNHDKNAISLKDKIDLYDSVERDNYELKDKLLNMYKDLKEYLDFCHYFKKLQEEREKIIFEKISFQNFGGDECSDDRCLSVSHCLIKPENDLVCIYCGATTKDYSLSKEDLEFLIYCAKKKGIYLQEVTKEDMPLLSVLLKEQEHYRNARVPLGNIEEDYMNTSDMAEEYYLDDISNISELRRKIRQAHILDTKKYLDRTGLSEEDAKKSYVQLVQEGKINDVAVRNPNYLTGERLKEFQMRLENKFAALEDASDDDRNSLLEECMTYKYELLIVSGNILPDLIKEVDNELEKKSLVNAYINMSDPEYRINSGYFKNTTDAVFYDCITASHEINQKILEMKLKRN